MKTIKQFQDWLDRNDACEAARDWIGNRTAQQTWDECPRGDWLLWWCQRQKVTVRLLTLAKGKCAETVIHLMKDQRSKDAVIAAIAFGEGKITRAELNKARNAAYDATAYDATADYATDYAAAVADAAADYATAAYDAAVYADAAADYAAAVYADARERRAAREANQLLTANIVRSIIKPNWL